MSPFDPAQIENFQAARFEFELALHKLCSMGIVTTVETVPLQPLAMGNHKLKVDYRMSKALYRPIMERLANNPERNPNDHSSTEETRS